MFPLRLVVFLVCLAGLVCLAVAVSNQNARAQERERVAVAPEYVIEVRKADGCLFAPIVSAESLRPASPSNANPKSESGARLNSLNSGSLVYTLPRPTHYAPDGAGNPIVSKVTFSARQSGDLWHVKVFVGLGEFYDGGEQQVADLMLATNERAEVGGLKRFSLSPFRVAVVKVMGQPAGKPSVNIKTQSLSLEKLEVGTLPEPHRLSLKNNSEKHVLALQYNTFKDHKFLFLRWREKEPTQPLIKAGEVFQLEVLSEDQACGDPDGYRASQSNRIDIVSVVFADGSYEGERGLAALIRGQALGNKKHLQRVVSTLANLSGGEEPDPAELIYYLRLLYRDLDEAAEPQLAEQLQNSLPPPHGPDSIQFLTNLIRSGQHETRTTLLRDAEQLEAMNRPQHAKAARAFGARTVAKYKEWLAAVEATTAY